MDKKNNEKLKVKIDKAIENIVACEDAATRKKLVDELMSLKGQYDVVPTLYDVPVDSVQKEYDFGAAKIIRTKKYIIYRIMGGVSILVSPRMRALYEYLEHLLSLKDKYDSLTVDEKNGYDLLYLGISTLFTLPCHAVVDDSFFSTMVLTAIRETQSLYERLMSMPLQDETPEENAKFENEITMMDEIVRQPKEK